MKAVATYLYSAAQPHSRTACALSNADFSERFPRQNTPFLLPRKRVFREGHHFYHAFCRFSAKPTISTSKRSISTAQRTISDAQKAVFPPSRAFLPYSRALAVPTVALGKRSGASALRSGASGICIRPSPPHPTALLNGSRSLSTSNYELQTFNL